VPGRFAVTEVDQQYLSAISGHLRQGSTNDCFYVVRMRPECDRIVELLIHCPPGSCCSPDASRIICGMTSSTSRATGSMAGLVNPELMPRRRFLKAALDLIERLGRFL
jgi:hypothetical protein